MQRVFSTAESKLTELLIEAGEDSGLTHDSFTAVTKVLVRKVRGITKSYARQMTLLQRFQEP
jgi:hypothetical protein